jgi:hypothetical protein
MVDVSSYEDSKELKTGNPFIKNFQRDAYPLFVMAANSDAYLPWMHSNFVQIMMNKEAYIQQNWYRVMYCNRFLGFQSPFLECVRLKHSYLQLFDFDICEFMKKNIDNGFYVMLSIDKFFVPNTITYKKQHLQHDTLVYGYETEAFKLIGYGRIGKFEKNAISFSAFREAFKALCVTDNWWDDVIYIFRYKENVSYGFNKILFKQLLGDYLYGRNTAAYTQEKLAQKNKDYFVFGVEVYAYYKNYLESLLKGNDFYDYMPPHFFAEHKQVVGAAINYLEDHHIIASDGDLYRAYKDKVIYAFELFLKLFIKADITHNVKYIKKILGLIDEALKEEERLLQIVYNLL